MEPPAPKRLKPGRPVDLLTFVCWKWKPQPGYRSQFTATHVNVLAAMIARHYRRPHRVICVTDDAEGIDQAIGIETLWPDHGRLQSPHGPKNPSCYRRLKIFSAEARRMFGERFVSLDLDCVITGDLVPLFERREDIVLWGDTNPHTYYNGGLLLMSAGAREQVWTGFDPATSPAQARKLGQFGSDQAWIGACLGPDEARWTRKDGVYSYRMHVARPPSRGRLPAGARIVLFHGAVDPWSPEAQRLGWVREHWRA